LSFFARAIGNSSMSLELTLNRDPATGADVDRVVVGVFEDGSVSPSGRALDGASGGKLAARVARGAASGRGGRTAGAHDLPGVQAPRVLLVGLGEAGKCGAAQYVKAVADAARALRTGPVASALSTLSELPVAGRDRAWAIRQSAVTSDHACY